MEDKKVSIIIPSYNNAGFLADCLSSVEGQTYKNIEVIIVDDGSTDNSLGVISEFKKRNDDVFLIKQFHQNASVARNRGLEKSTGDYVYFLDSDDELFDNNVIKDMVSSIDGYDLVIFDFEIVDKNGNLLRRYSNEDDYLPYEDIYKYVKVSPVPSNKLYIRDIIEKNNLYFSNVRVGQDLNFYLKYLSCVKRVNVVHKPSYRYRINPNGMTKSLNYNVLDICNSFEEVLVYYQLNNNKPCFDKYIRPLGINHFLMKMSIIDSLETREQSKMVFAYFDYFINKYLKMCLLKDNYYKKLKQKYRAMSILYKLRLYKVVKKVRNERMTRSCSSGQERSMK